MTAQIRLHCSQPTLEFEAERLNLVKRYFGTWTFWVLSRVLKSCGRWRALFRSTTSRNNDVHRCIPVNRGVDPGFRGVSDTVL